MIQVLPGSDGLHCYCGAPSIWRLFLTSGARALAIEHYQRAGLTYVVTWQDSDEFSNGLHMSAPHSHLRGGGSSKPIPWQA